MSHLVRVGPQRCRQCSHLVRAVQPSLQRRSFDRRRKCQATGQLHGASIGAPIRMYRRSRSVIQRWSRLCGLSASTNRRVIGACRAPTIAYGHRGHVGGDATSAYRPRTWTCGDRLRPCRRLIVMGGGSPHTISSRRPTYDADRATVSAAVLPYPLKGTWSLLDIPHLADFPAIRWRLQNLEQLLRSQPNRVRALADALDERLGK